MERWYLLITEKVLFWNFRWWEIRSFSESRSWWKDDIYWLLRSSCFEPFGNGKYRLFFCQNVDGKMIFTWYFWAFYDIPGPGKYGFSRSVIPNGLGIMEYMAFILNRNLVFIDSIQFMSSSLEKLVKNLSDNDLKYLTREFGSKNLSLETKRCLSLWVHRQLRKI